MQPVTFPEMWINSHKLEEVLWRAKASIQDGKHVHFEILPNTKILIDAAVIFLSLINQLAADGKLVSIDFGIEDSVVMGYLNRMGFFDHLDSRIIILPAPPNFSAAQVYNKSNPTLVEIVNINPHENNDELPGRLADVFQAKDKKLGKAAFTIFGELIDNVIGHSSSTINAYAALQSYKSGAIVIVSDSGSGLLETLRPRLPKRYAQASDVDILVEAFDKGLSRHRRKSGRGCGLTTCARKAKQFHGKLLVRLADTRVNLIPSDDAYTPDTAQCYDNLLPIKGTHIAFDFIY